MKTIQYAIHQHDGFVVSRVDSEVAWPILEYEKIGEGGDFTKPLTYQLEKMSVHSVGREWNDLVWTRYVPTEAKNAHRQFWGMKPLRPDPNPQTVEDLCKAHKTRFYYNHPDGLLGVKHGGLYHWFRLGDQGYVLAGTTNGREKASRHEVRPATYLRK